MPTNVILNILASMLGFYGLLTHTGEFFRVTHVRVFWNPKHPMVHHYLLPCLSTFLENPFANDGNLLTFGSQESSRSNRIGSTLHHDIFLWLKLINKMDDMDGFKPKELHLVDELWLPQAGLCQHHARPRRPYGAWTFLAWEMGQLDNMAMFVYGLWLWL